MQNPRECALDVLIKVDKKEELSHIAISNVLEKSSFEKKTVHFYKTGGRNLERQITIDMLPRSVFKDEDQRNVNH